MLLKTAELLMKSMRVRNPLHAPPLKMPASLSHTNTHTQAHTQKKYLITTHNILLGSKREDHKNITNTI